MSISAIVVAWEVLIGLLLLLPSSPRPRNHFILLTACAITLLAFTGALIALALDPNAPTCGCLGALVGVYTRHAQLQAIVGLVRNAALLWITLWLLLPALRTRAPSSVHAD